MDAVTVVEVRDAGGALVQRSVVRATAFSIGRGPDNDVIVDDEYLDPRHAVVTRDGEEGDRFRVRDLGTVNGTFVEGVRVQGGTAPVGRDEAIRLGESVVTFLAPRAPVAPARPMAAAPPGAGEAGPYETPGTDASEAGAAPHPQADDGRVFAYSRWPTWLLFPLSVVVVTGVFRLYMYEALEPAILALMAVGFLLLHLVWAGAWALGTRVATGRSRFREHLAFLSVVALASTVLGVATSWISFMASSDVVDLALAVVAGWLFWALALAGHLDVASSRSRLFKGLWAGGVAVGTVALGVMIGQLAEGPATEIHASLREIVPVPPALTRSSPPAEFLGELPALQEELAEEAEEKLEERPYPE